MSYDLVIFANATDIPVAEIVAKATQDQDEDYDPGEHVIEQAELDTISRQALSPFGLSDEISADVWGESIFINAPYWNGPRIIDGLVSLSSEICTRVNGVIFDQQTEKVSKSLDAKEVASLFDYVDNCMASVLQNEEKAKPWWKFW